MKIVLFNPEIPQNTGNILRTCKATKTDLILIPPLGFNLSNRQFKRAGLDYYKDVKITLIDDLENFLETNDYPFYFFSSKAKEIYTNIDYPKDSLLIFGSETSGLPDKFQKKWEKRFVRIPMIEHTRCLNLSNTVAIALYEALRQQSFSF
jgi:tRNA (cytidine/uridine-2'-O-)-methyltransferase